MRSLILLPLICLGCFSAKAQPPATAQLPSIAVVRFNVNPDVEKYTDKDVDMTMDHIVGELESLKIFSSVSVYANKTSVPTDVRFTLEGVVTRYEISHLAQWLSFGIPSGNTKVTATYQLKETSSGNTLVQKQAIGNGAIGVANAVLSKKFTHASRQLAQSIAAHVKKAVKTR